MQFLEDVRTIKRKSWVVRYDVTPNPRWQTVAIVKIENTQKLGRVSSDLHQILNVDVEIGANLIFWQKCENLKIEFFWIVNSIINYQIILKIESKCSEQVNNN